MQERAKVLFVDDEMRVISLLKMMFRSTYDVYTASSGSEALEIINKTPIDVIVSDQRMPAMLGIDLLSRVRKISPNTMRLLLTGFSDLDAIAGAVNEGEVYRFITKPWDHEELKAILADAAEIATTVGRMESVAMSPIDPAPDAALPVPGIEAESHAVTVLVLEENEKERDEMFHLLRPSYQVIGAASISEALQVLECHDVGVIALEVSAAGEDRGELLCALKQHYPLITSVMLNSSSDGGLIVKMINEAQIYRFALKPIRSRAFRLAVAAAMKEHCRLRLAPQLTARNRVATSAIARSSSAFVKSFARLRSRFSYFSA